MRGELELAQESLLAFQSTEASLQRTKKQYQQSVEHLAKAAAKHEKAAADPAGKAKVPQVRNAACTMLICTCIGLERNV